MLNESKGQRKTTVEFRKALEEELKTYYEPEIEDPDKANSQDLIRELYKVITGNGDFTKGLRYKVAVTSVMMDDVSYRVETLDGSVLQVDRGLAEQVEHCKEVQELRKKSRDVQEAEDKGRHSTARALGEAIHANKWVIFVAIVGALLYTHSILSNRADAQDMENKLASFIDARLKTVVTEAINGK